LFVIIKRDEKLDWKLDFNCLRKGIGVIIGGIMVSYFELWEDLIVLLKWMNGCIGRRRDKRLWR
jgi:hypothetical protein